MSVTTEKAFGLVLRELRQKQGFSQEKLGLESGYHRTYISQLERGLKSPTIGTLFRLAGTLQVTPSHIVHRVERYAKPRKSTTSPQ